MEYVLLFPTQKVTGYKVHVLKTANFMTEEYGKQTMYFLGYNPEEEKNAQEFVKHVYGDSILPVRLSTHMLNFIKQQMHEPADTTKIHLYQPVNLKPARRR
jgi:hypothetical protein